MRTPRPTAVRLIGRVIGRVPERGDDRGSLAMAMMAVLVGALLSAVILPMVISQVKSTRTDTTRAQSLHAAQTGLDVMLGRIRANVSGDPTQLPCGLTAVSDDGGYDVSVDYYSTSPSSESRMMCKDSFGTYNPDVVTGEPVATPRYAVIRSIGREYGGARGRTLVATYAFQTNDANTLGGQLRLFPGSSAQRLCMDAGSADPDAGRPLTLEVCDGSRPAPAKRLFAYRADLSIQLVSSVSEKNPTGLCVDTAATIHAAGLPVVLRRCDEEPSLCPDLAECSPTNQQWSFTDGGRLRGVRLDRSDTDDYCIAAAPTATSALRLARCGGRAEDVEQAWLPAPTTGAGMSGALTQQLVNRQLFATCLHVPAADPELGFLVLLTCEQTPDREVEWNQSFELEPSRSTVDPAARLPETVLIKTTMPDGDEYCLRHGRTMPLTSVRLDDACPPSATLNGAYSWTAYQDRDEAGNDLLTATRKFAIVPAGPGAVHDVCLDLGPNSDRWTPKSGTGGPVDGYLKAELNACDGSAGQKWNVRASPAQVTDTHEITTP